MKHKGFKKVLKSWNFKIINFDVGQPTKIRGFWDRSFKIRKIEDLLIIKRQKIMKLFLLQEVALSNTALLNKKQYFFIELNKKITMKFSQFGNTFNE